MNNKQKSDWVSLYTALSLQTTISIDEWHTLGQLMTHKRVAKGDYWVRAGDEVDSIALCVNGLFRLFYTTPDGKEFNKSFCKRHDFIAPYSSILQRVPSYFSIQALVDSEILVMRYEDFISLYERNASWDRFGRIIAEQLFIKKETRERELLLLTAEERYFNFLEQYGQLAAEIPQYHIASYLGITPVALSRIRKRINIG
ncbi:Crp/Fnr family transcriptional regulator [Paenibacillus sp. GSMTC-2017]|uniref:Crp/Fnr family transcriptional regulator n=1 Tax=Paenibacillus sp. GSMTC-2017 TaxID=2794350 RepID=UPI0018D9630E|nr:Crp/Fnr family transcriptional regulator [Paenibacillus sp. GSMTC-2017]MBH5319629.1 Crp/Fnr family transcriptional regulator [Paenibacillus sp. GSMTC-2017]